MAMKDDIKVDDKVYAIDEKKSNADWTKRTRDVDLPSLGSIFSKKMPISDGGHVDLLHNKDKK